MKKSIQILSLIAIFSISFFACDDNTDIEQICNVNNPLEDLKWLKTIKDDFVASAGQERITQYDYNDETVFLVEDCVNCPDGLAIVYSCEEETLCEFGSIAGLNTCPDFDSTATNEIVLYVD
jgi:hypothetical protein